MSLKGGTISDEVAAHARNMREAGCSWTIIAKRLSVSIDVIRRRIDPEYADHRSSLARQRRTRARIPVVLDGSAGRVTGDVKPTDQMLAAAWRRNTAQRPIISWLMGDPAPGESSLDKRRHEGDGARRI